MRLAAIGVSYVRYRAFAEPSRSQAETESVGGHESSVSLYRRVRCDETQYVYYLLEIQLIVN